MQIAQSLPGCEALPTALQRPRARRSRPLTLEQPTIVDLDELSGGARGPPGRGRRSDSCVKPNR